jgi:hypothetical protein
MAVNAASRSNDRVAACIGAFDAGHCWSRGPKKFDNSRSVQFVGSPASNSPPLMQIALVDLGLLHELVDLDGARGFQRDLLELLLRHLHAGVLVELIALDDVLVRHLLAGIGVDLGVLDPVPGILLSWLNETFSDSEVAGYSATGHVTSDRRRKPFQLARGAIRDTPKTRGGPGFKTNGKAFRTFSGSTQ